MAFSVLMSVYSKEKPEYLIQCLNSLCKQDLMASEVILVEDGPLGAELLSIIESYRQRLNIISPKLIENLGLANALNYGLRYCNNDLVARMDTDDICVSSRFRLQYEFMLENDSIAVCSGIVDEYNESMTKHLSTRFLPEKHDEIIKFARSRSPISHPATMFRKEIIEKVGGYPNLARAQDYGLWSNLIVNGYKFYNIQHVLVKMRCGSGLLERRGIYYFLNEMNLLAYQYKIGFLPLNIFLVNSMQRFILRLSPNKVKKFLYEKYR
ncbi:TPA: glycosyltransferase [Photobacterium damselae]